MARPTSPATPAIREVFEAVAKILPRDAVWVASNLKRTHQTAEAIWDAGFPRPADMPKEAAFAEQNLGRWQGMNRAAFIASRPAGASWFADINEPAPGGESFMDLYKRVTSRDRSHHAGAGRQGHHRGRPWRHHQGGGRSCARRPGREGAVLRHRQLLGDAARSFRGRRQPNWRLPFVNQQPWIADAKHAAMHQPAGPEVAKLA